ncbi:hypothetical protein [Halobacillus ihumii]|nr:hypothetical protein [Halobacillus ihumii]
MDFTEIIFIEDENENEQEEIDDGKVDFIMEIIDEDDQEKGA